MKNPKMLFLMMFACASILMFESCKPDACSDKSCNSGTLNEETCNCECPEGFSGNNCESQDVCYEANSNNEWGYDHFGGPDCWNASCSESTCTGLSQSPINITAYLTDSTLPSVFAFPSSTSTKIINNGHTLQFAQDPGSYITYGNLNGGITNDLTLGQFHFHGQSEHQVDGAYAPLEAHMVCRSIWDNKYVVLSVMFEVGASNPFLEQFIANLPAEEDDVYTNAMTYNPFDILPVNKSYYTYAGSLTTPPCSEIVTWVVMENKVEATQAQIDAFTDIMVENYRPLQNLNSRVIKHFIE